MTDPTIFCPNSQAGIKHTDSLAAPLFAATRKQFERRLVQKDAVIVQREQAIREKEKTFTETQSKLDDWRRYPAIRL